MSPQPVAVLDLPVELCFGPSSLSAPGSSAFSLCEGLFLVSAQRDSGSSVSGAAL